MDELTLFTFIGGSVTNAIDAFLIPASTDLMFSLQMTAMLGIQTWLVGIGYQLVTGSTHGSIPALMMKAVKVIVIGIFAFTADGYHNYVVAAFNGLESGLVAILNGNVETTSLSIYETLDDLLKKGFDLAALCLQYADHAGWNVGDALSWWATAAFISLGTLVFALIGGVNILIAKFSLAIMFALGPLFIMCLMFPLTAKFFDSWIGQVLNYIFTVVILAVVMTFGIEMFNYFVGKVDLSAGAQNPFLVGVQVLGLTAALSWIAMQAGNMAAGLAGGLSLSAVSLRQIIGAATSPMRTASRIINGPTTRRDLQSGMMVTAGRANHLIAGNTMWNPAYRQHVLQNLGKNWGRASGGNIKGK
jgi:type IV secretion system protein VirB6